jgi:hypothetical protein
MTVAMVVVPVLGNKCAWSGIKTQAKRGVAVSDKTLPRRAKNYPGQNHREISFSVQFTLQ